MPAAHYPRKVSVIMPCYMLGAEVKGNVLRVVDILKGLGLDYEVVVVDDGSPDETYAAALGVSDGERIKVVRHARNLGKGAAFMTGFKHSSGDVIVLIDGDLDVPPKQIALLLEGVRRFDVTITDKWHPSSRTECPLIRKFLSHCFNALVRFLTGLRLRDTQTGCKAFRRQVLADVAPVLTLKRYTFDVELLLAVKEAGYSIGTLPCLFLMRLHPKLKIREIIKMLADLLAVSFRHRILRQYSRRRLELRALNESKAS